MIHIAGGTYVETCLEPRWNELLGSGLRAALALQRLSNDVRLSTYLAAAEEDTFYNTIGAVAGGFDPDSGPMISVDSRPTKNTISFRYIHPLARPEIRPSLHLIARNPPFTIEAETVLRFGMLEGSAVVHGQRVIYDPQATYNPEPFNANGSTAGQLAIIANYREAMRLTGRTDITEIGHALRSRHRAEVAVVKRGALGATVFTADGMHWVPAYRTERVFPVGSGDVFTAAFAHYWGERGEPALQAAQKASVSAAYYCQTRRLPLPADSLQMRVGPPVRARPDELTQGAAPLPRVYLAGPFFTMAERWLVNQAREALRTVGVEVFSPFHDVGIGPAEVVAPRDIQELERCQAVLALADRADAGTLYEVGYARARSKPVVTFVQVEFDEPLKMLRGTDCEVLSDFASAIYHAAWDALERRTVPMPAPMTIGMDGSA
jgi:nucleoside 2-deoxyribosyltransferase